VENELRDYALGKQDLAKYKQHLYQDSGSYISIDWPHRKVVANFRGKMIRKIISLYKAYRVIYRMKNL
jgi:hypothetical protein